MGDIATLIIISMPPDVEYKPRFPYDIVPTVLR